jgi:hypothetical protein
MRAPPVASPRWSALCAKRPRLCVFAHTGELGDEGRSKSYSRRFCAASAIDSPANNSRLAGNAAHALPNANSEFRLTEIKGPGTVHSVPSRSLSAGKHYQAIFRYELPPSAR